MYGLRAMIDLTKSIDLGALDQAFTQGGNRLCFIYPNSVDVCVKVARPDRTPLIKRQQKKFPKNYKPLHYFDENHTESVEMEKINRYIGDHAFELMPKYYGMVDTNHGQGLCSELIIDSDNKISLSLKQYLWLHGLTDELNEVLALFKQRWSALGMPSKDLLLHNIVVQQVVVDGVQQIKRLVVIDGLGWAGFSFVLYNIPALARSKAARKAAKLDAAIAELLQKKATNADWGYHGWLDDKQRSVLIK